MLEFVIPGLPVGKGRPRVRKHGMQPQLYTPEKTASYESKVALAGHRAMAGRPPLAGPVFAMLTIRLPVPASWSERKQAAARAGLELPDKKKPDVDNVIKVVFDGLNGIVWIDDVQVVDAIVRKRYAIVPGVTVRISVVRGQGVGLVGAK